MGNITITQQDADFIANIMRKKLEDLDVAYKEAFEEGNRRANIANDLAAVLFSDDKDIQKKLADLNYTKEQSIKRMTDVYNKKKEQYLKIIELMMCGSN